MDCHRRHFGGLMRILAISPADVFLEPIWQRRGVLDLENHSRASAASRGEGCHRGPCRSNKTAKSTSGNLARRISAGAVAPVTPAGPSLNAHRAAPPRVTCGPFFVEVLLKRASRGWDERPTRAQRAREADPIARGNSGHATRSAVTTFERPPSRGVSARFRAGFAHEAGVGAADSCGELAQSRASSVLFLR
jgi:hypothetical protein